LDRKVRISLIIAIAIVIGPSLAYGSPGCMTQSEARAKFPKADLFYMRGSERCWDAGTRVHSPRRSARPAPSARPALAVAPMPSSATKIVNSGIDARAQCQYSPCE
jgi:hypothetical protein